MDDLSPFESARILVDGSKDRILDLEAGCDAFIQTCTYEIVRQREAKTGDELLKFRFGQRIPSKLRYIAGGIINDLRHALDHAFCDAAVLLGRPNAQGVHFPFSKSSLEIDGQIKRVCRGVEPALCQFVKRLQPYPGGNDILYKLSSMSNSNKHQSIIRISLAEQGITFQPNRIGRTGFGTVSIGILGWNEARNEITFARIGKNRFVSLEAQKHITPSVKIVLDKGEPPFSDAAAASLYTLLGEVDGIVSGIERETTRLLELRQLDF